MREREREGKITPVMMIYESKSLHLCGIYYYIIILFIKAKNFVLDP